MWPQIYSADGRRRHDGGGSLCLTELLDLTATPGKGDRVRGSAGTITCPCEDSWDRTRNDGDDDDDDDDDDNDFGEYGKSEEKVN